VKTGRWAALVAVVSLLPVLGLFTTSRIFFVRDLSFFFWSRHLWLRHTIFGGQLPWWDPHVAAGQSAIADALNQITMPLTLAIRLLPSDVVSFNLWVALPLPIAGVGMYAFLRSRVPPAAAALGGCIFALSGPVISMLNAPNLSWSVAFIPWVLWSLSRGPVAVSIAFALQALCGEPVTWAGTGLIAVSWIFRLKAEATEPHDRVPVASAFRPKIPFEQKLPFKRKLQLLAGLVAGALLAAVQLVPTVLAGMRANRAAISTPDFWSLHPTALWEAIAPNLFGNYYDAFLADLPWMTALNFGRDPFFYSLYVGPLVLLLAFVGATADWRRNLFWVIVLVVAVLAAMGGYTPFYPWVRKLFPQLMYFRFPVKYFVFAVFACAVLAAHGFASARDAGRDQLRLPAAIAFAGLLLSLAAFLMPDALTRGTHWLAVITHLKDPDAGALFLARSAPPLAARFFGLLLAGTLLVYGASRDRRLAAVIFLIACADLAITNAPLNLTMDVAKLQPPAWYTESAGPQRVYVGARYRGYMNGGDPDGVSAWQIPAAGTAVEGRMELNAQLPMAPSGWGVREALSYDLPYLWPAEYETTLRRFEQAGPEERAAFLRRSGVRRCVYPATEPRQFRTVAHVGDWNMRVFECNAGATRVYLASSAAVATNPADLAWQREALFDVSMRDDQVRLAELPRSSAVASAPGPAAVRITEDRGNALTIEATTREPAILVLRDTFDSSWHATVDGAPADIVRANGRYRAVAIPPGRHVIRFSYRPQDFLLGLMITVVTGLLLAGFNGFKRFKWVHAR